MHPLIERNRQYLIDKIKSRSVIDAAGCHLWQGALNKGYGCIGLGIARGGHSSFSVHRVTWELKHGSVPAGLQLDHLCRVRRCSNVEHLEPVTAAENIHRKPDWAADRCRRGHLRTTENVYMMANGYPVCLPCRRMHSATWNARRDLIGVD